MSNTTANAVAAAKKPITGSEVQAHATALGADSVVWLRSHWLEILIAVAVAVGIWVLLHALKQIGMRLCRGATAADRSWRVVIGRAIGRTGNFFIVMVAARLVSGYSGAPPSVATTINFLFTIAAVFQAAIWAREIILGAVEHRAIGEDHAALGTALGLIRLLVTFALFAVALIVVLDNLGVNVTGLVAGLGVGGIAIGLAAQGIFADLFAALAIIFDRPFRVGDAITYDKSSGTVEAIGLKSTRIRGANGEQRVISNKKLLDFEIINNSDREFRRVVFTLGIVQTTSLAKMRRLPDMVKEEIEANGGTFVRAGFAGFGAQSYDYDVQFDSPTAVFQDMFDLRHSIGLAIVRRLNDEGIALAYPTQTGLTAEQAGMTPPEPPTPTGRSEGKVESPPSSGDRSVGDQDRD